jgi:dCMP deaminase
VLLTPEKQHYYMGIAFAVRKRANCVGRKVGSLLVVENRIISTGYNGTPEGLTNCNDGGCHRCANRESYQSSVGYDVCICVHAEQNTLLSAARFGIAVSGAATFTTLKPCFGCAKELFQANVRTLYYLEEWVYPGRELQEQYTELLGRFQVVHVKMPDPEAEWARGSGATPSSVDDLGHQQL